MLFGKYGLPNIAWHGKAIFKDTESCPDAIKQHLEEHYCAEYEQAQEQARAQQMAEWENKSKLSGTGEEFEFKDVELAREPIMREHLQTLRQEMVYEFTLLS